MRWLDTLFKIKTGSYVRLFASFVIWLFCPFTIPACFCAYKKLLHHMGSDLIKETVLMKNATKTYGQLISASLRAKWAQLERIIRFYERCNKILDWEGADFNFGNLQFMSCQCVITQCDCVQLYWNECECIANKFGFQISKYVNAVTTLKHISSEVMSSYQLWVSVRAFPKSSLCQAKINEIYESFSITITD